MSNFVNNRRKPGGNRSWFANLWYRLGSPKHPKRWSVIFWSLILIPVFSLAALLFAICIGVFGQLPTFEELENPRSNIATELISSDGVNLGNFYVENRSFIEYGDLSPYLVMALVSTEDSRFYSHSGIDFIGLSRVAFKTLMLGQSGQGGGSTISQQLAKNLYPRDTASSGALARTGKLVVSKLKEWITATMLEYNYTKEEIISMYLNTMEYGSNSYGIKSAAITFFGKLPSDLTAPEAALLVGLVKAPTRYSPVYHPDRAMQRRNTVLSRMASAGYISEEDSRKWQADSISLNYNPVSHNEGTATYFREMLRLYMTASKPVSKGLYQTDWDFEEEKRLWESDPLYGWCNKNVKVDGTPYNLYRDGLKIYTTINSKMQKYAEESVLEQMQSTVQPAFDRQKRATRKIFFNLTPEEEEGIMTRSIHQSERARLMRNDGASKGEIEKAFNVPQKMKVFSYRGAVDTVMTPKDSILYYKSFLRTGFVAMDPSCGYVLAYVGGVNFRYFKYDMARQAKRQVGSTIKPFIYTFAINNLGFTPCTMVPNLPVTIDVGTGDVWSPKESGKVEYDGVLHELKWGLAHSRNNYSAWIMKQTSPEAVADFIHKMGIRSWIDPVYSLCVGTPEVSVMEMAAAFSTFANRGVYTSPFFVSRIEDKQGNTISSFSPQTQDVINENTAYTMLSMLQNNIVSGTGGRLRYMYNIMGEVGGKTGTTNNNADSWFMGVAPKIVGATWVGGEDRATHLENQGEGSVVALPVFGRFMNKVYKDPSLGITPEDKFWEPVGAVRYNCEAGESEAEGEVPQEIQNDEEVNFF